MGNFDDLAVLEIRVLGVPQVYTTHGLIPWSSARYQRLLSGLPYRIVSRIVAHSEAR